MTNKAVALVFVAAFLSVPGAYAQDAGPFLTANVGQMRTTIAGLPSGWSANETDTTFSIGGGYRFNKHFSAEGGYRDFGKIKIQAGGGTIVGESALHGTAWNLGAATYFPVSEQLELVARIGRYFWSTDLDSRFSLGGSVQASSSKADGADYYWGVGGVWSISKTLSLGIGATRFDYSAGSGDIGKATALDVGIVYKL